ncbi:MAG: pyrroline-5-carboxylate reductase [Coriobacteriales bacterium]|jgi:pyrroline-5-carboxylate reductase|nr:pyrroline-5-carboxylate reductase [Coriobacteriales bacterium]
MSNTTIQPEIFTKLGKIALIGGGRMGEAILAGLVHGTLLDPKTIVVGEPYESRCSYLSETYDVECVTDAAEITHVNTALFAVKPQDFRQVAEHLAATGSFDPERVISIAAGITTETIARIFPRAQVIRVMPNAPLMASAGMSVVSVAQGTHIAEGELVVELFSLMGQALLIDEDKINAATAISGSGPAYFALLVEELAHAGAQVGLTAEQAQQLALQTLVGTARQLHLFEEGPAELRKAVTSPGGTTQAALEYFASAGFGSLVEQAVKAACKRAEELA